MMHETDLAELSHLVKQLVMQAVTDLKTFDWGYISNYDPKTHRVRCIVPAMRDDDGTPTLTGWMPLGSPFVGAGGAGIQWIPKASATTENPTEGEQCMIVAAHPLRGQAAVPCMFFSDGQAPPAPQLPDGRVGAPGDIIMRTSGGSLSWMHDATGDLEQIIAGKLIQTVIGNVEMTTQGNATVTATGTASILSDSVVLGATGGKRVVVDGDPVSTGGVVQATQQHVTAG